MTTVVILMIGFGAILIISAIETDPTTGKSVNVLQTMVDVWQDNLDFSQPTPPPSSGAASGKSGQPGQSSAITQPGILPGGTAAPSLAFRSDLVRHDVRYRYGR